jgi:hypothetical protein
MLYILYSKIHLLQQQHRKYATTSPRTQQPNLGDQTSSSVKKVQRVHRGVDDRGTTVQK